MADTGMTRSWTERARQLKADVYAVCLATRDRRVPWYARFVAICVVAYAFSPIDLIPDPIPVLGYLDDLILLPAGVALVIRLIPASIMDEHRQRARAAQRSGKPTNWVAAGIIVAVWLALFVGAFLLVRGWL